MRGIDVSIDCWSRGASRHRTALVRASKLIGRLSASNGGYAIKVFYAEPPFYDPISRMWSVRYKQSDAKHQNTLSATFTVIIDDKSSRAEVSCLGISGIDYRSTNNERVMPPEIEPFIPAGEFVVQAYCVDLNGDGRPDYLVAIHADTH